MVGEATTDCTPDFCADSCQTKDFVKFLGLVAILYIGFDTTFAFLARGTFSVGHMNWILVKVFFVSSWT